MGKSKCKITIYDSKAIQRKILTIQGEQVMLDSYLAAFYGVETKVLNQAVKRNIERFPRKFMYQLKEEDWESLRSQFVTLGRRRSRRMKNDIFRSLNF